jgi:large subunit ribosomal protein L35
LNIDKNQTKKNFYEEEMHKIKTNSGAKKRFKISKNGKVKRAKAFRNHMLNCKTTKRKRQLRKPGVVSDAESKRVKMLLPYAS